MGSCQEQNSRPRTAFRIYDVDKSLDNYKLFKNHHGEAFSRYIGSNYKNGSPKKNIWVPKTINEALPVTTLVTMKAENAW